MANATIHIEGRTIATTLCGRPTEAVFWLSPAHNPDDLAAVTCKRCRTLYEQHAETHQAPTPAPAPAPADVTPCDAMHPRYGFPCEEPAGDDHERTRDGALMHRAVGPHPSSPGETLTGVWATRPVVDVDRGRQVGAHLADLAQAFKTSARGPLDRLGMLQDVLEEVERLRPALVDEARATGASWAAIGNQLGITKQGAAKTYGERRPAPVETGPDLLSVIDGGAR